MAESRHSDSAVREPTLLLWSSDQLLSCIGISPQVGKVASGGSGQQRFWLLVILEKAAPSDDASTSPMEDSHWLSLGRMPISEPITIAGDERY